MVIFSYFYTLFISYFYTSVPPLSKHLSWQDKSVQMPLSKNDPASNWITPALRSSSFRYCFTVRKFFWCLIIVKSFDTRSGLYRSGQKLPIATSKSIVACHSELQLFSVLNEKNSVLKQAMTLNLHYATQFPKSLVMIYVVDSLSECHDTPHQNIMLIPKHCTHQVATHD